MNWVHIRKGAAGMAVLLIASSIQLFTASSASANHESQCKDVTIVFARGSGQALDYRETPRFFEQITSRLSSIDVNIYELGSESHGGNSYPAVGASTALTGGYLESKTEGSRELNSYLTDRHVSCPDEVFILGGYSQGADVTRDTLFGLDRTLRDRILFVALFGDPSLYLPEGKGFFPGSCWVGKESPWRRGNVGCLTDAGVLGARVPYLPDDMTWKTGSWCDKEDPICNGNPFDLILSAHGEYADSGAEIDDAAAEVARVLTLRFRDRPIDTGVAEIPTGAGVSTVLIIDSSGSKSSSDPLDRRLQAAEAYLSISRPQDSVGVVDFDSGARIASEAKNALSDKTDILAGISSIDSDGGTVIGAGISVGCDVLSRAANSTKAALLFTDGRGSYNDEAACFRAAGWPIYTFALGSGANNSLLERIANETGGEFRQLPDTNSLICEFATVRGKIAGVPGDQCGASLQIQSGQTLYETVAVAPNTAQVSFTNSWPGSDIEMTAISPSGARYSRHEYAQGLSLELQPTFEILTIQDPETGDWNIELFGSIIPDGGEPFSFSSVQIPNANQPPQARVSVTLLPDGRTIEVDSAGTIDPDGQATSFLWSFGEESPSGSTYSHATGETASHTFLSAGEKIVALEVEDVGGAFGRIMETLQLPEFCPGTTTPMDPSMPDDGCPTPTVVPATPTPIPPTVVPATPTVEVLTATTQPTSTATPTATPVPPTLDTAEQYMCGGPVSGVANGGSGTYRVSVSAFAVETGLTSIFSPLVDDNGGFTVTAGELQALPRGEYIVSVVAVDVASDLSAATTYEAVLSSTCASGVVEQSAQLIAPTVLPTQTATPLVAATPLPTVVVVAPTPVPVPIATVSSCGVDLCGFSNSGLPAIKFVHDTPNTKAVAAESAKKLAHTGRSQLGVVGLALALLGAGMVALSEASYRRRLRS